MNKYPGNTKTRMQIQINAIIKDLYMNTKSSLLSDSKKVLRCLRLGLQSVPAMKGKRVIHLTITLPCAQ